ncbi:uncharacterized protein LY89DRAFT_737457 [Mollisia scopiformis]|uniref:Uncharacterized protein n=1 Tax=Mollisia scopiformis TaxID=149040 RepID=A0A194WZV5_MOLSC|nr:uncharacterized protein LY89DRAFT_737457 [Mollisia scopiformis]KUJ13478.1 hypothetical protein LY89DRAFT_737457 [Mollisia scopiformis]
MCFILFRLLKTGLAGLGAASVVNSARENNNGNRPQDYPMPGYPPQGYPAQGYHPPPGPTYQ